MKATALAPANIAFIKYWGRKDTRLRLPYNASISMNLSACTTTTTVEFSDAFTEDRVIFMGGGFSEQEVQRVIQQLDRIRGVAGVETRAKVVTQNSFPKSAGVASSASGFAALTVAAAAALDLKRSEKELTVLARLGSGSACRSIPDGFVKWEDSFAYSLYPPGYWDLRDILVIVEQTQKDVSSSAGHEGVTTSPNFAKRLEMLPQRIARLEDALKTKNFALFGEVVEEECLDMHHVMQTQTPPLFYWNDVTKTIMEAVVGWRKDGLPVYFTIDAGPNVHLICEGKDEERVVNAIKSVKSVKEIIVNKSAEGAHVI
jgi:diphosphomevalonate decarboxylase